MQLDLSNYDVFFFLNASASITLARICVFFAEWVNSQWPDQSDHETRIWRHEWVASEQRLQAPPPFFPPGYAWLASFLPHSTWQPVRSVNSALSLLIMLRFPNSTHAPIRIASPRRRSWGFVTRSHGAGTREVPLRTSAWEATIRINRGVHAHSCIMGNQGKMAGD